MGRAGRLAMIEPNGLLRYPGLTSTNALGGFHSRITVNPHYRVSPPYSC